MCLKKMQSSIPIKVIVLFALLLQLVHSNLLDGQKGITKQIYKGKDLFIKNYTTFPYNIFVIHPRKYL